MASTSEIEIYEVHTFTRRPHGGNPAGVCVSAEPLKGVVMQAIAIDLGPSVTAFIHDAGGDVLDLRWFTRQGREVVTFCGHATFGAAHVMLNHKRPQVSSLVFSTTTGKREIRREAEKRLAMSAPSWPLAEATCPDLVIQSVKFAPEAYFRGPRDMLLAYQSADELRALAPDYNAMLDLGLTGVIATAPQGPDSFAFRFFCPSFEIGENEDPATGSALSTLGPYWRSRLGMDRLQVTQLSARGGRFELEVGDDAVVVRSRCATFLSGRLAFDPTDALVETALAAIGREKT